MPLTHSLIVGGGMSAAAVRGIRSLTSPLATMATPNHLTVFDSECFGEGCGESQVIEGPIPLYALCEHHALPFFGHAHVGYIAGDRMIGISKLIRPVRVFARRFTVQERLGQQVAGALDDLLAPRGVAVCSRRAISARRCAACRRPRR